MGRRGFVLPGDLAVSLRDLDDGDFDRLLLAVIGEARRRGRPLASESAPPAAPGSGKPAAPPTAGKATRRPLPVPPGQARLVRAAYEAGVKPGAIARELRLSRAQVEQVIDRAKGERS